MSITLVQREPNRLIRLQGRLTVAASAELKSQLLDGIASGKDLEVDMENADEIDLSILQLLWAASRDATERGVAMVSHPSEAATLAARDAGFDRIPGAEETHV